MTDCGVTNASNITEHFVHNQTCPTSLTGMIQSADGMMGGGLSAGLLMVIWLVVLFALQRKREPFIGSAIAANFTTLLASFFLFVTGVLGKQWPIILIFLNAGTIMFSYFSRNR